MDIPDCLKLMRKCVGILKGRQQDDIVDLSYFTVLFINRADFSRYDKARLLCTQNGRIRDTRVVPEDIKPLLRWSELFL